MKGSVYLQLAPGHQVYHKAYECDGAHRDRGGYGDSIKIVGLSQGKPRVARGNLLVRINLVLPDDAFTTFIPEATVTLSPSTVAAIAASAEDFADDPAPDA